jgi:hypothetical protein
MLFEPNSSHYFCIFAKIFMATQVALDSIYTHLDSMAARPSDI